MTAAAIFLITVIWKNGQEKAFMLLNTVLTVRAHQANSHRGIGWEEFTDAAIRVLNEQDRTYGLYALGKTGTDEEIHVEQSEASDSGSTPSQSTVCVPRFLWMQAFQ